MLTISHQPVADLRPIRLYVKIAERPTLVHAAETGAYSILLAGSRPKMTGRPRPSNQHAANYCGTAAGASCDDLAMAGKSESTVEPAVHIKWAAAVADHDYAAADAYLSLKLNEDDVAKAVRRLRKATLTSRRANDILRAAGLTAAPLDDPGVMKDLIKVVEGEQLSPVLVLSGKKRADIADGFHRVSLVYRLDPYASVPLKIA